MFPFQHSSRPVRQRRPDIACAALLFAGFMGSATFAGDESLAHQVPRETGLFVELRGCADLLHQLIDPQIWIALAEVAGQPARPEETEEWRQRIQATVGLSADDAIDRLFSQRVAFVGEGPGRAQDAAVLCTPTGDLQALVQGWNPQALPPVGRYATYLLAGGVGMALRENLLVFGDAAVAGGMYRRIIELGARPPGGTLADDPTFAALVKRLPVRPDGLCFVRLGPAVPEPSASRPASAPASAPSVPLELPGPLRGARNILLGLHRTPALLHISSVGDAPPQLATTRPPGGLRELVGRLPPRTLAAWGGYVDYPALLASASQLPPRNLVRVALEMQRQSGGVERLAGAIGPRTCVALGVVSPQSRAVTAPPVPAIAVLIEARDPNSAESEWTTLLHASASVYNLLALKASIPALPAIEPLADTPYPGEILDLSGLLGSAPTMTALSELHLAWARDGDTLIFASHVDWLKEIVAARRGNEPPLNEVLALAQRPVASASETLVVLQSGPLADLANLWLAYLAAVYPDVLQEKWWRAYQPGGSTIRLGVDVTALPEQRALRVDRVMPGSPADGVLRPGDELIGANKTRFATSQPAAEMLKGVVERPNARWIELTVARDGSQSVRRVPLPFIDPIILLRRAAAIGRIVQRVVYSEDVSDPAGPRGLLTLESRQSNAPLFPFDLTPSIEPVSSDPPPDRR